MKDRFFHSPLNEKFIHFGCRIASFVIVETTKISCCSVMAVTVATILTVSVQKWKTFLMVTGE